VSGSLSPITNVPIGNETIAVQNQRITEERNKLQEQETDVMRGWMCCFGNRTEYACLLFYNGNGPTNERLAAIIEPNEVIVFNLWVFTEAERHHTFFSITV
jgi:hypothetical protein